MFLRIWSLADCHRTSVTLSLDCRATAYKILKRVLHPPPSEKRASSALHYIERCIFKYLSLLLVQYFYRESQTFILHASWVFIFHKQTWQFWHCLLKSTISTIKTTRVIKRSTPSVQTAITKLRSISVLWVASVVVDAVDDGVVVITVVLVVQEQCWKTTTIKKLSSILFLARASFLFCKSCVKKKAPWE